MPFWQNTEVSKEELSSIWKMQCSAWKIENLEDFSLLGSKSEQTFYMGYWEAKKVSLDIVPALNQKNYNTLLI